MSSEVDSGIDHGRDAGLGSVCVFCGSSPGNSRYHAERASELGTLLAQRGIRLVYGGAHVGMMGVLADAALAAGGEVVGVIPQSMVGRELAHTGLSELHVVAGMHERKALMAGLSEAFIALPGGIGTLEELFEIWTWLQIGLHAKPIGLLDVAGFYQPLLRMIEHITEEGFMRAEQRETITVEDDASRLLAAFERPLPAARSLGAAGSPPAGQAPGPQAAPQAPSAEAPSPQAPSAGAPGAGAPGAGLGDAVPGQP